MWDRLNKKRVKFTMCLLSFLAIALIYQGWNAGVLWGVTPIWKVVEGVSKGEVVLDDDDVTVGAGRKANVLFLLDVGSTMVMTPTGTLPDRATTGWTQAKAAEMLKDSTYGAGGLPLVGTASYGSDRYGRDLEKDNNATLDDLVNLSVADFKAKHIDNYYFPFDYAGHPLNPLLSGSSTYPLPYALVIKKQSNNTTALNYWRGITKPTSTDVLVPNDSRMYKMKLVMWRLLEDASLFEHLRFGMATTFQEMCDALLADFYKSEPYGKFGNTLATFMYGTGPSWATGLGDNNSIGQGYYNSQTARTGVLRDLYDNARGSAGWIHINRAVLRVPIADYSTSQRDLFRMWIDGYENANTSDSTPYYFTNPELFADGKTYLSTALFPGHPALGATVEAKRQKLITTTFNGSSYPGIIFSSKNGQVKKASAMHGSTYNIFNKGSGEALGTILDFFSPPTNAKNVNVAPVSSFPLKDNCESNWVVVFTAGDDSQAGEYSAAQAAKDLYEYTRDNNLTKLKSGTGSTNTFENIKLDDGIRTLVVGFVDDKDPATQGLRDRLNAMAKAGDPGNAAAHAYFANNVPGLIEALRAIMVRINSEMRPAKGPMTESSSLEASALDGAFDLFSASYKVNENDQWQGQLERFESAINKSRDITVKIPAKWELGKELLDNRSKSSGRNLVYWNGSGYTKLDYSTGSGEYNSTVASLLGLQGTNTAGDFATWSRYNGKLHPSRALINWLHGYDFNYATNKEVERKFMLSDFGQSGVIMVGPPATDALDLPGYEAWANSVQTRDTRVFAQSNEGILHVVNPVKSGSSIEQMAILPPPVMQPFRLAATKFTTSTVGVDKKVDWVDNERSGDVVNDGSVKQSRPAYVLDGPLYQRDFDMTLDGNGWGTYLVGMLGRAGNGFYIMDVTQPSAPKFLWSRETVYQSDGSPAFITMGGGAAAPTYTPPDTSTNRGPGGPVFSNPNGYPFYQMGYNMPRAVGGVALLPGNAMRNMIVLSGGLQERLDLNNNGYMGAALYIVDPVNGYKTAPSDKTKVFNSGSLQAGLPRHRAGSAATGPDPHMGMLVTPPSLLRSLENKSTASKIFTADNRGNIFMVNLEDGLGTGATPLAESAWSIQTVGSLRNKTGETAADDNHAIPHGILLSYGRDSGSVWVSGGTANIGTRNNDNQVNKSAQIKNKGQYLFAFRVTSDDNVQYRNDWVSLNKTVSGDAAPEGSAGWYIKLDPESPTSGDEYVTARPVLMAGTLYFSTFILKKDSATCESAVDGTSRIYAIDLEAGAGGWGTFSKGKYIEIRGIRVAGLTHSKKGKVETVVASWAILNKATSAEDLNKQKDAISVADNGLMGALRVGPEGEPQKPPFDPLDTYINYWREVF